MLSKLGKYPHHSLHHSNCVISRLISSLSERKWKLKLKEWGFEKYLPAAAMKILVAKAERRAMVENKETVFFHRETQIPPERIELFKRRRTFREGPMASPSQSTCSLRTTNADQLLM
jgi:hypothetical protein